MSHIEKAADNRLCQKTSGSYIFGIIIEGRRVVVVYKLKKKVMSKFVLTKSPENGGIIS